MTPSTTTYAVLSLLAEGERSAYELAKVMDRTVRFYWPRAISRVYEEPKRLVAAGWAKRTERRARGRTRTVYSITEAGREALRGWLAQPGAGPALEFEGLVKILAADHGDIASLRATLDRVEADAEETLAFGRAIAERVVDGDPELVRGAHLRVLTWRLLWEHAETVAAWARWARSYVDEWDSTTRTEERTASAVLELRSTLVRPPR